VILQRVGLGLGLRAGLMAVAGLVRLELFYDTKNRSRVAAPHSIDSLLIHVPPQNRVRVRVRVR